MGLLHRVLVYVFVTAIIEVVCISVLYSYGYPNSVSGPGALAWFVGVNFLAYFLWGNAVGGPQGAAPQGSLIYNPLVQLVGGVVGMFIIVTVIGEGTNWLSGKIVEMAGTEKEAVRFKRRLDSAVHDFVETTFASKQVRKPAEKRINDLYSQHPARVLERLFETLDRVEKTGTTKTAARVEMLIKELQERTLNERSSEPVAREP